MTYISNVYFKRIDSSTDLNVIQEITKKTA